MSPLDKLVAEVRRAVGEYDKSGDHNHAGGPYPGDCIRCALLSALPGAYASPAAERELRLLMKRPRVTP